MSGSPKSVILIIGGSRSNLHLKKIQRCDYDAIEEIAKMVEEQEPKIHSLSEDFIKNGMVVKTDSYRIGYWCRAKNRNCKKASSSGFCKNRFCTG